MLRAVMPRLVECTVKLWSNRFTLGSVAGLSSIAAGLLMCCL
jgi:hypothetical protein